MINHFKGRVQIPLRQIIRQRRIQVRFVMISAGVGSTHLCLTKSHSCLLQSGQAVSIWLAARDAPSQCHYRCGA